MMDALVGERAARLERLARRLKTNEARLLLIDEVLGPHIDAVVKNYDPSRIRVSHGAATLAADIEQHRPDFALYFKMRALPREQTELLFRAPDLAWLHLSSVGTDHVADWRDFPVTVTNALGVLSRFSADYAITSMLALNIDLHRYAEQKPDRLWRQFLWQPLEKQTALVVGVGAIGGIVASRAKALGMRVIGVRANPRAHPGVDEMVKTDRLAEVIGRADYVFLCLPLIPATRNLFDAAMLARMKPGARLVNLARGGIVDEQALIAALESGHISGAVLDVFANEPLPADDPLWRARNLIITPHISGSTLDWKEQISAAFNDMVADLRAGKALRNVVDPVLRY